VNPVSLKICLAVFPSMSHGSSCAKTAQKRTIRITNAEATNKAASAAEQGAHVAPETAPSMKGASKKKSAPKLKKGAKGAKAKAAATKKEAKAARSRKDATEARSNKKAEVIAMMKRAKGATLAEIMETTGWQTHTVRGFVSILGSKGGEKVESSKNAAGERSYRIAK